MVNPSTDLGMMPGLNACQNLGPAMGLLYGSRAAMRNGSQLPICAGRGLRLGSGVKMEMRPWASSEAIPHNHTSDILWEHFLPTPAQH